MQLCSMNFSETVAKLERGAQRVARDYGITGNLDVALLFHEATNNPCSERVMVQQWFKENGYEIHEWGSTA